LRWRKSASAIPSHLKVRSCLIDGGVVCCDERGRFCKIVDVNLSRMDITSRYHRDDCDVGVTGAQFSSGVVLRWHRLRLSKSSGN